MTCTSPKIPVLQAWPQGARKLAVLRYSFGFFACLVILTWIPSAAGAVTFSTPLTDLVGPVDFFPSTGGREAQFDFEQQFAEIQNVWIEVDAMVRARSFDVCGLAFDPQPCVRVIQLLGFAATMDKEDSPNLGLVFSDGLSFSDDIHALEGSGLSIAIFNNTLVGWDFLLDGEGSLTLFWNRLLGNPDRIIQNVIEPSGEIFGARLIVEAVPIPEPSTCLLLAAGLLALGVSRRLRSCQVEVPRGVVTSGLIGPRSPASSP